MIIIAISATHSLAYSQLFKRFNMELFRDRDKGRGREGKQYEFCESRGDDSKLSLCSPPLKPLQYMLVTTVCIIFYTQERQIAIKCERKLFYTIACFTDFCCSF